MAVSQIRTRAALFLVAALGASCSRDVVDAVGRAGSLPSDGGFPPDAAPPDGPAVPVTWPNAVSFTNSDPWLAQHHDSLLTMQPRVLVLDFYNPQTTDQVHKLATDLAAVVAESSRYHALSDPSAPPFMMYQIGQVVDLLDHPATPAYPRGSSLVPVDGNGAFDATQLFTQRYADLYGIADSGQPAHNLTLCELFERGTINEVWMAVGDEPPRGPLIMERKQIYDATFAHKPGQFEACAGNAQGTCLTGVTCGVTVRLAHLSQRGVTCDVEIRGLPFESQGTLQAIPYMGSNAASFFNADFHAQGFGVSFNSWYDICDNNYTPCISYPTPTQATGMTPDGAWKIDPFIQGCGSVRFPPNAHFRNDWLNPAPVQSRCEHFAMKDGAGGMDVPDIYTVDKVRNYTTQFDKDCGGGWQIYLRQNMPGLRNLAFDVNGKPMKNWWPFLFY